MRRGDGRKYAGGAAVQGKCSECGHKIKRSYFWGGRELGIECWKKIALPLILAERERRDEERQALRQAKGEEVAAVFRAKDLSRISNEFKLQFIPSIIEQVEQGRLLSNRQFDMCYEMFNGTDHARMDSFDFVTGETALNLLYWEDRRVGYNGKLIKLVLEALDIKEADLPAQVDPWGEPFGRNGLYLWHYDQARVDKVEARLATPQWYWDIKMACEVATGRRKNDPANRHFAVVAHAWNNREFKVVPVERLAADDEVAWTTEAK